jgi:hypothetical protein
MCSLYIVVELKYISLHSLQHQRDCLHAKFPIIFPSLIKFKSFLADFGKGSSVSKFTKIHSVGAGRTEGRTQMKRLVGCFRYLWERDIIYLTVKTVRCHYKDRPVRRLIAFRGEGQTWLLNQLCGHSEEILSSFTKFREATGKLRHFCLSTCNNSAPTGLILHEIWNLSILRKFV